MSMMSNIWRPKSLVMVFLTFDGSERIIKSAEYFENEKKAWSGLQTFDSVQEVVKHYGNSKPYHLNVNGTGVLSRKLMHSPTFKEDLIVSGDKSDFTFSYFRGQNQLAVSFFRTKLLDEIREEFNEAKGHLIGLSSGAIALMTLQNFEMSSLYDIEVSAGEIRTFKKGISDDRVRVLVEGEYVNYFELLSKMTLALLKGSADEVILGEGDFTTASLEYTEHRKFVFFGVSITLLILSVLLANFFYHGHLNDRIAQQELDLSVSQNNLTQLDQMDLEIMRKSELINASGIMSKHFIAYYLDEIGQSVPLRLNLSEMNVYPLTKKLKAKHKVEVDKHEIKILGTTENNEVLDDWIEDLTAFDWIESVKLIGYLIDEKEVPHFELKLKLRE